MNFFLGGGLALFSHMHTHVPPRRKDRLAKQLRQQQEQWQHDRQAFQQELRSLKELKEKVRRKHVLHASPVLQAWVDRQTDERMHVHTARRAMLNCGGSGTV